MSDYIIYTFLPKLASIIFAILFVYGLAYVMGQDANNIVGWAALGMAATAGVGRNG